MIKTITRMAVLPIFLLSVGACAVSKEKDYANTPAAIAWLKYHNNDIPDACINYYLEKYIGSNERTPENIKESLDIALEKASIYSDLIAAGNELIKSEQEVFNKTKEGVDKGYLTPQAGKDAWFKLVETKNDVARQIFLSEFDNNNCEFEEAIKSTGVIIPERSADPGEYLLLFPELET